MGKKKNAKGEGEERNTEQERDTNSLNVQEKL